MVENMYSILIDTNAMAKLSLYVEICECAKKEFGTEIDKIKEILKSKGVKNSYLKIKEIEKGYNLFKHLKQKNEEFNGNVNILFSSLSEMELFHLFLESAFDEELTKRHVPYLARRKKFLRLQVDFNYEDAVLRRWDTLKETTDAANIGFICPERENNDIILDIGKAGKIVSKYVVLDTVDLYLYVLGIYLMVDEIYTTDNEFRTIINNIRRDWKDIRQKIQNDLKANWPHFREEYKKTGTVRLPEGRIKKQKKGKDTKSNH